MQNYTDEIIAKFPNLTCSVLNGGVNVYYHKYVITIWWKKQSYCDTAKHKWVRFTSLEAIIQVIEAASMPKPKKASLPIANAVPKTIEQLMDDFNQQPWQIVEKYGVQDCINHILKKRDFIMQNQPDNKLAAFCLTLSDELKQYL